MKRLLIFSLATLLILSVIPFLTYAGKGEREHMVYSWSGPEGAQIAKLAEYWNQNFADDEGFTVKVHEFGREEFFTKMVTMITSKSDTWQGFMVFNFYIPSFAEGGNLVALDKYFNDSEYFKSEYTKPLKASMEMVSYNGQAYGAPQVVVSIGQLRYREDLINKLLTDNAWKRKYKSLAKQHLGKDLEPKAPDRWNTDDYLAAAIFFTKKYNPESPTEYGTVFQGMGTGSICFISTFYQVLKTFGGDLITNGKASLNTPQGLAAIRYLLDQKRKYDVVPPDVHKYEAFELFNALQSGKVANAVDWDWDSLMLNSKDESPLVWDKLRETITPSGPNGRWSYVQEFAWVINNHTSDQAKEDMAKFLIWASCSEKGVLEGLNVGIPPGVYIPKLLSSEYGFDQLKIDHYKFYYDNVISGNKVKQVWWPMVPPIPEIHTILGTTLQRALAGEITYEEALKTMDAEINEALGK